MKHQEERRLRLHTDRADDLSSREKIEAKSSSGVDLHDSIYPNSTVWSYLIWHSLWSGTDPPKETES